MRKQVIDFFRKLVIYDIINFIPFFIIGGMVLAASSLISFAAIHIPILIFAGPIIIAIGSVIGWLVLAFESPYAIACLRLSAKAGVYTTVAAILHIILQFFFTLDVIDIMFLTFKERRWKKLTIFIIILLVTAILLLGTLIVLGISRIPHFQNSQSVLGNLSTLILTETNCGSSVFNSIFPFSNKFFT